MEQEVATEPTAEAAVKPVQPSTLEIWAQNERMRHIPTVEWILRKVDVDLRRRIDVLLPPYGSLATDDPHRNAIDRCLEALCRALDRLADVAKHSRLNTHGHHHTPQDLPAKIRAGLANAVTNLGTVDAGTFGRRFPFHTFERSKGEPLYGALLVTIRSVERLVEQIRLVDHGVDERLLSGLVTLSNPVDERMLRPIA